MNRPRLSLPAWLPPELWVVIGMLCGAGLFTGIPALQALPDAVKLVTDGGLLDSLGLLVLVLVLELGFFAAACFVLAWQLSQGDAVARVVTVVVSGSLAFGLLLGDGFDDGSATVTMLCSVAGVAVLTVGTRAREYFATQRLPGRVPVPVVAAEAVVVMLSGILLAVGVAYVPLVSLRTKYGLVGVAMVGMAVSCFRARTRLRTADPTARALVSGFMAGAVLAVIVGTEGSLTGPLFIPLGMAVAVVALLWVPQESQAFFGSGPALARMLTRPAPPPPPSPPEPSAARPAAAPPVPPAARPPAPAPAPPTTRLPTGDPPYLPPPPPPPPPAAAPPASATPAPVSPATPPPPPPAPPSARTPPRWLLEAPPAGFWPAERRRAQGCHYEVVDLGPSPHDERTAPTLGIRFDSTSWFPTLDGREQVRGAYLVSMVMFGDSPEAAAFRGTSTLLVTSSRLVGVCPRGESATGPLDPGAGRVAVWRVLLDQLDWVRAEGSAEGGHLIIKGWDSDRPWALLTKPRVAADGAFRPARLADVVDVVNRAKHSSA